MIHANSDTMRRFLWRDLFKNSTYYDSNYLVIHAIAVVSFVYVVGVIIDQIRIRTIEKPLFAYLEKYKKI